MTKRIRDQSSYWENGEAVSDIYELLVLLKPKEKGDFRPLATRYLHPRKQRPEVVVRLHEAGEGEHPLRYYEVLPSIAKQAAEERLVESGARDDRGVYQFDDRRCVLSDRGQSLIRLIDKARKSLAKQGGAMFLKYHSWGGGHIVGTSDTLYVEFETPQKERVRVYPNSKQALGPAQEKECA